MNPILEQVKSAIRSPYAWPGGYPVYTFMEDGELLCPDCARDNYPLIARSTVDRDRSGWAAIGAEVYWEGPAEPCEHCGKALESAYGDPADSENYRPC